MRRALLVLPLLLALAARAQDVPTPLGLLVLLKVVTYDVHFGERAGGDFVVLVPYEPSGAAAARALVDAGAALETKKIKERPLVFETTPLDELEARLKSRNASAVLVPPGLKGEGLSRSVEAARRAKVYSLGLSEESVKGGAMVGVSLSNQKPQPLLNTATAKASGVEFAPAVLRVARTL